MIKGEIRPGKKEEKGGKRESLPIFGTKDKVGNGPDSP